MLAANDNKCIKQANMSVVKIIFQLFCLTIYKYTELTVQQRNLHLQNTELLTSFSKWKW